MNILYLGHSCFALSDARTRIVTDPYGDVGFDLPRVEADIVTVSHGHYDHCNVGGVGGHPAVLDRAGTHSVVTGIPSWHDGAQGAKRGPNVIFKFLLDGLDVCHLGDLGEKCSNALLSAIGHVDVLLLPVGGVYTIDAAAAADYVKAISPAVAIPMHYKTKSLTIGLGGVEEFLRHFGKEQVERRGSEISLTRADLGAGTKIIVMERKV